MVGIVWCVHMPKYFIRSGVMGNSITLTGDDARHLLTVLRVGPGDSVLLCDGAGMDYVCVVQQTDRKANVLVVEVRERQACLSEPPAHVTLYQALPKSDKMDWIVQKCVEMGVSVIVPVMTARVEARVNETKIARWQRISASAAQQSMRGMIPQVESPLAFEAAVTKSTSAVLQLIAYENERGVTVRQVLAERSPCETAIWIGPEGGFTDMEITQLRKQGETVTLGPRILRTETAATALLAQLWCIWED